MSVAEAVQTTTNPHNGSASALLLHRKCACGGSAGLAGECEECQATRMLGKPLQAKLRISEPGDEYEREADRVADQVMRMPDAHGEDTASNRSATPLVQRRVAGNGAAGIGTAPSIVHDVLSSPGQPLDAATRAFFEGRFGYDFGSVRVHADAKAAESANVLNAVGYTVAPHIVLSFRGYGSNSPAQRSLVAHELGHVVQQSQPAWRTDASYAASRTAGRKNGEPTFFGAPMEGLQSLRTGDAILQRQPAPGAWNAPRPTDDDLLQLLNRFAPGEPVTLYHVDETGNVLRNVQQNGRHFSLKKGGEFHLTTNVEARTGFKSGAGLNTVIAFYLDPKFVSLLEEVALPQKGIGKLETFFKSLVGINLAIPRFTFEGGGRGQGRSLWGTGDYNIALRSFNRTNEWNRLFRLSIQRIEHLQFNEALPAGSRLERVAQLYPLLPGPILQGTPLPPAPVSGGTPLLPGPVSGSRPLLPGPESGATPLLPGPTAGSTAPRQVPAPLPVYEPTTLPPSQRPPVKGLLPGPVSGATPLLPGPTAGGTGFRPVPVLPPVHEPTSLPPRTAGKTGALGAALAADTFARWWSSYVTEIELKEAQQTVNDFMAELSGKLERNPDVGAVVNVSFSAPIPDVLGTSPEYPPTFLGAGYVLVPGLTFREAQEHYLAMPTSKSEPDAGIVITRNYQWFPPLNSTESPQGWRELQYGKGQLDQAWESMWESMKEVGWRLTPGMFREE